MKMTFGKAIKMDSETYPDLDHGTGLYCVFGNETGFAYTSHATMEEAQAESNRWNEQVFLIRTDV